MAQLWLAVRHGNIYPLSVPDLTTAYTGMVRNNWYEAGIVADIVVNGANDRYLSWCFLVSVSVKAVFRLRMYQ